MRVTASSWPGAVEARRIESAVARDARRVESALSRAARRAESAAARPGAGGGATTCTLGLAGTPCFFVGAAALGFVLGFALGFALGCCRAGRGRGRGVACGADRSGTTRARDF